VVLSEERARDNPASRVYRARQAFLLKDQLPPRRDPIGKVEVLQNAPASLIADYYKAYYRPDRAVLVAAGDFDLDAMEAKIKAKFGDWTAKGPAGPDPVLGPVAPRTPEAKLVIEPGAPLSLQLVWIRSPDSSPDSLAVRRRDLIEYLGFQVLNRRFSTLARAADPPFLGAGAFTRDEYDAAKLTMVTVNAEASRWKDALTAAEQEQRRAIRYGVRQDELDREIEELRANVKADAAAAATRTPAAARQRDRRLALRQRGGHQPVPGRRPLRGGREGPQGRSGLRRPQGRLRRRRPADLHDLAQGHRGRRAGPAVGA
jgi:zinc protease